MDTPQMRFVGAKDYYKALLTGIPKAQKRVIIHAMDVRWGPQVEVFIPLLLDAVKRGLEVRVVGDVYSKFQANLPQLRRADSNNWRYMTRINNRLRNGGVQIAFTGKIGLNPFSGRTHSKVTIIDDHIFTFGGVNFSDSSFTNADYMLSMRDPILADRLHRLLRTIEKDEPGPLPDLEEQLGGLATLLFDGGRPKVSVIYETACRLAASARKVYYVSQMCPSGRLAKFINAADNECYFIRPHQADPPANLALIIDRARFKVKNRYTGTSYIHAKFILTEDKNGSKHIISGSNNFSWRGIAYGTKEIAIHSTDPALWQQFYDFLQTEIKQ
jgi:cardiolipin synthase